MEKVMLPPFFHKGIECIGIFSPQNATLNGYFQKAGAKWSRANKCWHVPCTEKNYEQVAKALKGRAVLQTEELKKYLLARKKTGTDKVQQPPLPVIKQELQKIKTKNLPPKNSISQENKDALQKFTQQLVLKSYSASTLRTYSNEFMQFLQLIKDKPANEFTVQRIKDYLQYCFEKLKLSE
jgi:integrase/recombinase XerD